MTSTTNRLFVGGSYNVVNTTVQSNLAALDITAVTGIAAQENSFGTLSLYPNPATDEVWIENTDAGALNETASITLSDLSGRVLLRLGNVREHRLRLQLPELATGMYVISWKTETTFRTAKFSKQ